MVRPENTPRQRPGEVPELPEVETIVRDLRRLVVGSEISETAVVKSDLIRGDPRAFEESLRDRQIRNVERRAKNIVFHLARAGTGPDRLVINLGMTGRVLVQADSAAEPTHLGVRFRLADGRRMLYQDVRRFGSLELLPSEFWERRSRGLGVEPLSETFTPALLHRLTRTSRVAIKTWLMDQRRVVGIGNIYASEALFRAGVSPRRATRRLLRRQTAALYDAIVEVLNEAIAFRGTTFLDYRDASGERGGFVRRLLVYDREGEPCPRCGSPIRRIVQGGRSTFFCPKCQR
ncbi:MAG: bifunctional DNA-formamidopyrimidine glycosylase/DNA-(apurinic or apyrimidinic site) lyase [Gemmatimonas sp.]|nr:bifunctional DNA-formamidopyrimidine glycosylase/DNA-(apurinic or apyrimidinic site) lyase [Gemmatimonas sp.]